MERMVEVVPESDHQAIQQFISDSRWDARTVMDQVAQDNEERCLAAKIPKEEIVFKTKKELALEIVEHARELGLRFGCVGAD